MYCNCCVINFYLSQKQWSPHAQTSLPTHKNIDYNYSSIVVINLETLL